MFVLAFLGLHLAVGATAILMAKYFTPTLWRSHWGRRVIWGAPLLTLVATILLFLGRWQGLIWIETPMGLLAAALWVSLIAATLVLPISGILRLADWLLKRKSKRNLRDSSDSGANASEEISEELVSPERRYLLMAGATLPALAMTSGVAGVLGSYSSVKVFELPLRFPNLSPDLEGFRILHLCDLHLGLFYTLNNLEELTLELEKEKIDLIVVVGDFADRLDQLPDALRLIAALNPRYGAFATLGNHEYYRGIKQVYRTFNAGPIPLLVNSGEKIQVGASSIYVGGADDPVSMRWGAKYDSFYDETVERSMRDSESESFKLLLTHRPWAFEVAAKSGVDLSLAGHTHGGQVGFMGKSVFDVFNKNSYLWGEFEIGQNKLYTSSGIGHWFPFRLGCPTEAPIITLRKA
ncbi:MAG: metallophosphoesterase [candidate division Zixibacteria bacterium]|nr:metallophosphoesterase [candidate division Zixibacteria bacterium]